LRPGPVERPLEVALGAPELGLEEPVDGEEDDAVKALHLKTKKQTVLQLWTKSFTVAKRSNLI
jgi:hypothetical protein